MFEGRPEGHKMCEERVSNRSIWERRTVVVLGIWGPMNILLIHGCLAGSRTSTSTASRSSANTGPASTTTISNCGSADQRNGSLTSVCLITW